ncbi:ATP-grasp domain-containing protein, partial [Photobacterium damselae]
AQFHAKFGNVSDYLGLAFIEPIMVWAAEFFAELEIPFSSPAVTEMSRDKFKMRQQFQQAGLLSPKFNRVTSTSELLAHDISYPLVVKPTQGFSSINVTCVDNTTDLLRCARLIEEQTDNPILVEEYIAGDEISLEGYINDTDGAVCLSRTTKFKGGLPYFEEVGQYYNELTHTPSSIEKSVFKQAVAAVGLTHSIVHLECIVNREGYYLVEIGARLGGDKIPYLHRLVTAKSILLEFLGDNVVMPTILTSGVGIVFFVPRESGLVKNALPQSFDFPLTEYRIFCTAGEQVQAAPEVFFTRLGYAVVPADSEHEFKEKANLIVEAHELSFGIKLNRIV